MRGRTLAAQQQLHSVGDPPVTQPVASPRPGLRRGSALVLVLLMTLAVAALAVAAIFMTSSSSLLGRFYDKERLAAYAAESGLNLALSRIRTHPNFTMRDTDTDTLVIDGEAVRDADGAQIAGVRVFVHAMRTGDVTPTGKRTFTLVSRAVDGFGTRHLRRADVRQESITRYVLFIDNFPDGLSFGPTVLSGRVHSNGKFISDNKSVFRDSVSVVGAVSGGGTYRGGVRAGADAVPFPRDNQFTGAVTTASASGLSLTPTANRPGRIEFVALPLDGNNDGVPEDTGAFVRYFELESGLSESFLTVNPATSGGSGNAHHPYDDPIIQNQCGAFYFRNNRWQFFPVATHRATWAWNIINVAGYPTAPTGGNQASSTSRLTAATKAILQLPTSRCFPAGSPYLMPTERLQSNGTVLAASLGYGGQDTTFTAQARRCSSWSNSGTCTSTQLLGNWRTSPSTYAAAGGATLAPSALRPTHWPIDQRRNTAFNGVVNVSGSTRVSGVVRGNVTLRVGGTAHLVDHLRYESDPNDPAKNPCTDLFGLIATADILVVDGAMTRLRVYGTSSDRYTLHLGASPFFLLHGFLLSSGGTVGIQNPATSMVAGGNGLECRAPPDESPRRRASGGCFVHVGGAAMETYSQYSEGQGSQNGGLLPFPVPDRCQDTGRQPPAFPQVASFRVLRTMEVGVSRARDASAITALLRGLRGTNLD